MRLTPSIPIIIAGILNASTSAAAIGDPLTDAHVTIRTYDGARLTTADRAAAIDGANAILRAAGIRVDWVDCDPTAVRPAPDPCASALGAAGLAIRFVRLPPPAGCADRVPLGYSLIDTRARAGALATVYVDRVASLAREAGARADILLGRAVAHEIGHLLLGSKVHTHVGVMRPVWSIHTVRRERNGDWLFTPAHASALREAIRSRTTGPTADIVWGN